MLKVVQTVFNPIKGLLNLQALSGEEYPLQNNAEAPKQFERYVNTN